MKTLPTFLSLILLHAFTLQGFGSDQTANAVLAEPHKYNNAPVQLDVAFLRPVRWKSPIPEVAFFHAMTYDKKARSFGGEILLAAPESNREALVRRYGVTHEGRRTPDTNLLRATLRNTGEDRKRGIWYLDQTEGALSEAIQEMREKIQELEKGGPVGPGGNRRGGILR